MAAVLLGLVAAFLAGGPPAGAAGRGEDTGGGIQHRQGLLQVGIRVRVRVWILMVVMMLLLLLPEMDPARFSPQIVGVGDARRGGERMRRVQRFLMSLVMEGRCRGDHEDVGDAVVDLMLLMVVVGGRGGRGGRAP